MFRCILEKLLSSQYQQEANYMTKHAPGHEIMKKVNKQCLLDTPRTVRVSEKTWQVIVRTRRP